MLGQELILQQMPLQNLRDMKYLIIACLISNVMWSQKLDSHRWNDRVIIISADEINRRIQSLIGKDYSELSPDEYEFMVANGYSYNLPMTLGEKIVAAFIIIFVIGSAIAIYKLGFFIFFVLLIPVLLLISVFICIYGLVSGENEDKPFYLIVLTASAAMLIAIFNSANSSVFRDE